MIEDKQELSSWERLCIDTEKQYHLFIKLLKTGIKIMNQTQENVVSDARPVLCRKTILTMEITKLNVRI